MNSANSQERGRGARLRALLTGRHLPITLAILAMLLAAPSLWVGFVMDDHFHRIQMLGSSYYPDVFSPSLDLFRFFDGDPETTRRKMDIGLLPWWTYERLKAGFWRPLTVLTHWLDYKLWPDVAALMHLHSLFWFGAVVAVVTLLYRRLMGATWVAGLAALFFAIDDAHGMPVGFLANRNSLPAMLFGVLAMLAHDKWRRDGRQWGAILGPVLFAVSLLAKESAVAVGAYLLAYALFLDRASWRRRFYTLLPYVGIVLIWRIAWTSQGYGLWGMGPYVDPGVEPLRFAAAAVRRAPLLLLGQWAFPPAEAGIMLEPGPLRVLWLAAVSFLALLILVMIPLLRQDRLSRFWATGMALSILPACATFVADRLLFFVGIGAMGLLARFLAVVLGGRADRRPAGRLWRVPAMALALVFIFVHAVAAPILLPLRARYPAGPPRFLEQLHVYTPLDESVEDQALVIVNPPSPFHALFLQGVRALAGQPVPRYVRILAPGYSAMTLHRPDARTLVIRPDRGYLAWTFDNLFRGAHVPMSLGQRVELTGLTVEITAITPDNRPAEATFHFTAPLEDPSLRWLFWKQGTFIPFTPPPIGETIELPEGMPAL